MQEQINERSVSLAVRGTKLTAETLAKSLNRLLAERKKTA